MLPGVSTLSGQICGTDMFIHMFIHKPGWLSQEWKDKRTADGQSIRLGDWAWFQLVLWHSSAGTRLLRGSPGPIPLSVTVLPFACQKQTDCSVHTSHSMLFDQQALAHVPYLHGIPFYFHHFTTKTHPRAWYIVGLKHLIELMNKWIVWAPMLGPWATSYIRQDI